MMLVPTPLPSLTPEAADVLDRPDLVSSCDPAGIMHLVTGFDTQCQRAVELASSFAQSMGGIRADSAILAGLGGSAIAGDLAKACVDEHGCGPMMVSRDYGLPSWAGPNTLVVLASYSGDTEETLSACDAALTRGCQVVGISSGGELCKRLEAAGRPVCLIPGGQPPRTATGYILFPLLAALHQSRVLRNNPQDDAEECLEVIRALRESCTPEVKLADNPAKQLAAALHGRIPVITGSVAYLGAIANRWKGQFNENAKVHAMASVAPEQNHNEILAWQGAAGQTGQWAIVNLRDPLEAQLAPRHALRAEITRELIGDRFPAYTVTGLGRSLLARMMSLFCFGDYVSVYAAYLNGVDPNDIGWLHTLKARLRCGE